MILPPKLCLRIRQSRKKLKIEKQCKVNLFGWQNMELAVRKQINRKRDSVLSKLPVSEAATWVAVIVSSIK